MSYPTPMDVAEAEDRDADLSPSERLANICAALEEDLNESPFTREEWERMNAERVELLAANDTLTARLAEYESVIIPSWKREEEMWREDEANAIEFRRVLAEAHALADRIIKRNQGGYIGDHNDVLRIRDITADSADEVQK